MDVLDIRELKKSFGDHEVLRGISLSVSKGEVLSVLGPSGSGKTTLLRIISGLEKKDSGEILLNGESEIPAGNIGLVFQSYNLFPHMSVLKNLTLPYILSLKRKKAPKSAFREAEAKATGLLESVGLSDRKNESPGNLSGGESQRVAIARALMLDPAVLLFDEPTSALDPEKTREVLRVIRELKKEGKTMIIVTHEIAFAREVSDVILLMKDGEVVEQGTPEELFRSPDPRTIAFLRGEE